MNHRVKQLEEEMEEMRTACDKNDSGLQKLQQDVGKLAEEVKQQAKKVEETAKTTASGSSIFEELRERESRRLNVVMYGIGEAPADMTGLERWDWDLQSCGNLFSDLSLGLQRDCIKFCRRVGEVGPQPRPMVVGFYEEGTKVKVLRCDTRGTAFSNVEIGPDLTKQQKQEELDMKNEAVKRNREMGDSDRAKNLAWLVVGPRGEKRLVKRYVSLEMERRYPSNNQSRGMASRRGARTSSVPVPMRTGANNTPLGPPRLPPRQEEGMEEEEVMTDGEETVESEGGEEEALAAARARGRGRSPLHPPQPRKQRLNSKRKETEEGLDTAMEPPPKH
jgi:hypothetical protein